jgi:hypothetical protein
MVSHSKLSNWYKTIISEVHEPDIQSQVWKKVRKKTQKHLIW